MPRRRAPAKTAPRSRYRSPARNQAVLASAARVDRKSARELQRLIQEWQGRALSYYDLCGEARFPADFHANALSQIRLFPGIREGTEIQETDEPAAVELLDRIHDPGGIGRSQFQGAYGRLMFLTGEGFALVTRDGDDESWEFVSSDELRIDNEQRYRRLKAPGATPVNLQALPDDQFEPLAENQAVAYRFWRRHPRYSGLADSPMHSVLDLFEELVLLQLAVRARIKSRLASSGLLVLDDRITQLAIDANADPQDPADDAFLQAIIDHFTTPIRDEGSASAVVPYLLRISVPEDRRVQDLFAHIKLHDPNETYRETGLRLEVIKRIAIGIDLPPEILLGLADANHWCVDQETEILTNDRGWIRQDALEVGDRVLTLNHESGLAEWQFVQDIYRAAVVDEPMRSLETRTHSSLTTMQHRWPVLRQRWKDGKPTRAREWACSAELGEHHWIQTCAPAGDLPSNPIYSDDLVELAAWFWTEGSVGSGGRVTIAQSHTVNPDRVKRIRGCLDRMCGPAVERLNGAGYPEWAEATQSNEGSHGGPITVFRLNKAGSETMLAIAPRKRVRSEFILSLTKPQLELFIDVSCQGDGHHYRTGQLDLWQRNPEALDAFELACILAGYATSRQPSHDGGAVVRALRSRSVRPVKAALQAARRGGGTARDETRGYTGTVWCPVTENSTWLARRNGRTFFTGNSAWAIDDQVAKAHIFPVARMLCADLTTSYLRPAARDAKIANADDLVVGFDADELVVNPDRSSNARELYDRGEIGGETLRDAHGFTDDDAMKPDERARWETLKLGQRANGAPAQLDPEGRDTEQEPPDNPDMTASAATVAPLPLLAEHAARIVGAGEIALERARELAGSRVRALKRSCPDCFEGTEDVPNRTLVASLGPDTLEQLSAPAPAALVAGGCELFVAALDRWGVPADWTATLAEQVERHAARTLYEQEPSLPAGFARIVERLPEERAA